MENVKDFEKAVVEAVAKDIREKGEIYQIVINAVVEDIANRGKLAMTVRR